MSAPHRLRAIDLLEGTAPSPIAVVDLSGLGEAPDRGLLDQLAQAAAASATILVGWCDAAQTAGLQPLLDALTVTIVEAPAELALPATCIATPQPAAALSAISAAVRQAPTAALVLRDLLNASTTRSLRDGLVAESTAYSMLLAAPEFAAWRAGNPAREDPGPDGPAVLLTREAEQLTLTLNRPERHNAFSRWVRDAACEGLDLALADPTIRRVTIRGAGPSFCSGGDLDEFGSQPDVAAGHVIRLERSVALRLDRLSAHTVACLHGACIGAGMELAAFADEVRARPGTWFALPELAMGLIPGAGGTVSLPRRIGRWRTAWLAMSGHRLDLDAAIAWGLVDARADG